MNIGIEDVNKMELPEWDVVKATPIRVSIGQGRELVFEIPTVRKYFDFETVYLKYVAKYFVAFSQVNFLEYKDFKDTNLKEAMVKTLHRVMQMKGARTGLVDILSKYFKANFDIRKIEDVINPMQFTYLFLFIHKVVETVKKKFLETLVEIDNQLSRTFSISLQGNSGKVVPRF